jgi:hypothetical protein
MNESNKAQLCTRREFIWILNAHFLPAPPENKHNASEKKMDTLLKTLINA